MKHVLIAVTLVLSALALGGTAQAESAAEGARRGAMEGDRVGGPVGAALGGAIGGMVGGSARAMGRDLRPSDYRTTLPSRPGYRPVRMKMGMKRRR